MLSTRKYALDVKTIYARRERLYIPHSTLWVTLVVVDVYSTILLLVYYGKVHTILLGDIYDYINRILVCVTTLHVS